MEEPYIATTAWHLLLTTEQGFSETTSRIWELSGWNGLPAVLTWPQPHWTLVGSAWARCLCQNYQHNHGGWLATNAGWITGCYPTAVCDQAGGEHEEEVPGCCGCVWFFHMLLRTLFVEWINCCQFIDNMSCYFRLQSTKQHQTRVNCRISCLAEKI